MNITVGIISILIAFAILIFLSFKGMSVMYVAPICALFVAGINGIPLLTSITEIFVAGAGGFMQSLFAIFLLSILMGRIYIASGAAPKIAKTLMGVFAKNADGKRKQTIAVFICIAVSFLMCYGGIDTFCALFTLFPVMATICKEANIPRKFMVGLITCGVSTAAITPGAPLVVNSIPMGLLGTSSYAGLIPGLIGVVIMVAGGGFYLTTAIHKASAAGLNFEYGSIAVPEEKEDDKYPNFILCILPLVAVVIVFNVVGELVPALLVGFILSLVCFWRNIEPAEGKSRFATVIDSLNEGGKTAAESLFLGGVVVGFATVVQATDAYQAIIDGTLSLNIPGTLLVVFAVTILVGLTGSPPAGLQIVIPVLSESLAISPEALHRIASTASQTFDTLPFQGAIIIMLGMAGLKHKEGYMPVFMCTVVWTMAAALAEAFIFMAFPGLG
ncbi:MAG: hypothetical protein K6G40_00550 [Eubacterium sp.]|nr:hypothetical protein [Eubacterium sp.]